MTVQIKFQRIVVLHSVNVLTVPQKENNNNRVSLTDNSQQTDITHQQGQDNQKFE